MLQRSSALSERNSFPTCPGLLSAVGNRMYSSRRLRGGNAHVTRPAQYVAILLVTTVMDLHLPARLELWQNLFQWYRPEAWRQMISLYQANSTWTLDQQTVLECLVAWHVRLSIRIQLVKTNSAPLASDSQIFTFNVCRNTTSLILASLTCSGCNSAYVNSWKNL